MDIQRKLKQNEATISSVASPPVASTSIPSTNTNRTPINSCISSSQVIRPTGHVHPSPVPKTSATLVYKTGLPDVVLAQKCRNIFVHILEGYAKKNDNDGKLARALVQNLLNGGVITEELFLQKLFKNLTYPKAQLLYLLKKSLPPLRQELENKTLEIPGIIYPAHAPSLTSACPTPVVVSVVNQEIPSAELKPKPADYEEVSRAALNRITLAWKNITEEMKQAGIDVVWDNDNECVTTNNDKSTPSGSTRRNRKVETEVIDVTDSDSEENEGQPQLSDLKMKAKPKSKTESVEIKAEPDGNNGQTVPSIEEPHCSGGVQESVREANAIADVDTESFKKEERIDVSNGHEAATISAIATGPTIVVFESEIRLIGVMSAYLQICPLGATAIEIVPFIQKIIPTITAVDIQNVLKKFPILFKQENFSGETCEDGRIWKYVGYHS